MGRLGAHARSPTRICVSLAVALGLLGVSAGCARSGPTSATSQSLAFVGASGAAKPARSIDVRPTNDRGELSPGYVVTRRVGGATCVGGSLIVSGNVFTCDVARGFYDPCWPAGDAQSPASVYCIAAPWTRQVTQLALTEPLPELRRAIPPRPLLWGVQLASGLRCTIRRGTPERFHGLPVRFTCGRFARLLGEPEKTKSALRIREIELHKNVSESYFTYGPIETISVAWYGVGEDESRRESSR
jgi:hypothetical protein